MREQASKCLPYAAFFGYFLGGARKYHPWQGNRKNDAIISHLKFAGKDLAIFAEIRYNIISVYFWKRGGIR